MLVPTQQHVGVQHTRGGRSVGGVCGRVEELGSVRRLLVVVSHVVDQRRVHWGLQESAETYGWKEVRIIRQYSL